MNKMGWELFVSFIFILTLGMTGWAQEEKEVLPTPPREFRAAWVATVANIDWPTKPGLTVEEQKNEAIAILDKIKELNMNAVVFQVRPHTDAMYKSELEPWSYYLTGEQGKAPDPFYDPLEFWVKEAHDRGIEVHTWYNPYRANHSAMRGPLSEKSLVKAKPHMVRKLGDKGYYWMDPAMKEVQDHSIAVVMDVVKRYDIDGVHFDDYFYPYPEYNDGKDFPDDDTWKAYQESGGKLSRGDWRREAVNVFVKRLSEEIKAVKPYVKFSISPFGIYRPGYPESIKGFDQYDKLYADALLWFKEGWLDFFTPQLYWPISQAPQSFPVLLGWWQSQNAKGRHLWPGFSFGSARNTGRYELINQIMITRGIVPEGPGHVFFSMKGLQNNKEICDDLLNGPYKTQCLIPSYPWIDSKAPENPTVEKERVDGKLRISWKPKGSESAFYWVVYTKQGKTW
ncbi:family 10 glycosylhydrolase, partial [Candidatus Sumerlaeota bacterium]|nr:family 10 glycosylhydrolase [Candidatus Sumerlaeota bacterium]